MLVGNNNKLIIFQQIKGNHNCSLKELWRYSCGLSVLAKTSLVSVKYLNFHKAAVCFIFNYI